MAKSSIYYVAILLKNAEGRTPFDDALKMNSPKLVEIFLKALIRVEDFNTSWVLYKKFKRLFAMKIASLEHYLESCFFQTTQMWINKLYLSWGEETVLWPISVSILDGKFFKQYGVKSSEEWQKEKQALKEEKEKIK